MGRTRAGGPPGTTAPRARRRARSAVAALLLGAALVAAACTGTIGSADDAVEANAEVVRIVDGDTVLVALGDGAEERVRLIGIDTPESVKPGTPVMCFGKEATAHLGELIPAGTAVRLERDVEARDRYDRLLAYVYRASDGEFVNLRMAADGFADQATYPPNVAHVDEFRDAVRSARDSGSGLWSA
ncbi:MAG: thermonuclease family protein, partial [Microthrixaceae bacterium]